MPNLSPNLKYRYEFDKTGKNKNNLVTAEAHVLNDRKVRVFMPRHAHFYINETFSIIDKATGKVVPRTAYWFDDVSETVAMRTGLGAASIVIIADPTVSKNITVTYQAVGGEFTGADVVMLQQKLESLNLDNRPIDWNNIRNKPPAFNPAEHFHPIWQTFGYEHLVYVVERLVQATLTGDVASQDLIWEKLKEFEDKTAAELIKLRNEFNLHAADKNNPHKTTAEQVNTYIKSVIDAKIKVVRDLIDAHAAARGNVHGLTPAILGVYDKKEIDDKLKDLTANVTNLLNNTYTKVEVNNLLTPIKTDITKLKTDVNTVTNNLANNYYTKTIIDKNIGDTRDFAESTGILVQKMVQKAVFGRFTAPTAQLTNKSGGRYTLSEALVNSTIGSAFGTGLKLPESIIPISTAAYNQLRWNNDGLYYGTTPDASTATIYVDPDLGIDETITIDNGRGTRNKPVATIAFALAQGSSGVTRTILLAEGKEHFIGKDVDPTLVGLTDTQFADRIKTQNLYIGRNSNHWQNDNKGHKASAYFRGGTISFNIYGPRYEGILARYPGRSNDIIRNDHLDEIMAINTRVTFVPGLIGSTTNRDGVAFGTMYCTSIDNGTSIFFYCVNVTVSTPTAMSTMLSRKRVQLTSRQVFSWQTDFSIELRWSGFTSSNLIYIFGGTTNDQKENIFLLAPSTGKQSLSVSTNLKHFKGESVIISCYNASAASIFFQGVGEPVREWQDAISLKQPTSGNDRIYFSGIGINGNTYMNVSTNILPRTIDKSDQVIGRPVGTMGVSVEYRAGKLYALYKETPDSTDVVTKQIWPATWA